MGMNVTIYDEPGRYSLYPPHTMNISPTLEQMKNEKLKAENEGLRLENTDLKCQSMTLRRRIEELEVHPIYYVDTTVERVEGLEETIQGLHAENEKLKAENEKWCTQINEDWDTIGEFEAQILTLEGCNSILHRKIEELENHPPYVMTVDYATEYVLGLERTIQALRKASNRQLSLIHRYRKKAKKLMQIIGDTIDA